MAWNQHGSITMVTRPVEKHVLVIASNAWACETRMLALQL